MVSGGPVHQAYVHYLQQAAAAPSRKRALPVAAASFDREEGDSPLHYGAQPYRRNSMEGTDSSLSSGITISSEDEGPCSAEAPAQPRGRASQLGNENIGASLRASREQLPHIITRFKQLQEKLRANQSAEAAAAERSCRESLQLLVAQQKMDRELQQPYPQLDTQASGFALMQSSDKHWARHLKVPSAYLRSSSLPDRSHHNQARIGILSTQSLHPYSLPPSLRVPQHAAWQRTNRNEQAVRLGQRMFLNDESGETTHVDDDADVAAFKQEPDFLPWDGPHGNIVESALEALAIELGWRTCPDAEIVRGLAEKLDVPEKTMHRFLQICLTLIEWPPILGEQGALDEPLTQQVQQDLGVFCRLCKRNSCQQHERKLHLPYEQPQATCLPCGPRCWLAAPTPQPGLGSAQSFAVNSQPLAGSQAARGQGEGADVAHWVDPLGMGWCQEAVLSFDQGVQLFGASDVCGIATLVSSAPATSASSVPCCSQVAERLARLTAADPAGTAPWDLALFRDRRTGKAMFSRDASEAKGKRRPKTLTVLARQKVADELEYMNEWLGCTCHEAGGRCEPGVCPCMVSANFCEKSCGCSRKCTNRWPGCACVSRCSTSNCLCKGHHRECDPDVCIGCRPSALRKAHSDPCCTNMPLRLRRTCAAVIGTSSVPGAGFGLFMAVHGSKDDCLGEYCGEVIENQEGDRRGKAYDKALNSFLFQLSNQSTIDSKMMGSKQRMVNHSASRANCVPRNTMVDGQLRIALYLKKDVEAGEELFFDYGYAAKYINNYTWHGKSQRHQGIKLRGEGSRGRGGRGGKGAGKGAGKKHVGNPSTARAMPVCGPDDDSDFDS